MSLQSGKQDVGLLDWLNRRLSPAARQAEEPRGERPEDWPSFVPFRRRPKPLLRVVSWRPAGDESRSTSGAPELFVTQAVLRGVRRHLAGAPEHETFGFLVGRLFYCPWTKSTYALADRVFRSPNPLPAGRGDGRFRNDWHAAWTRARERDTEVLGWYHRHGLLGVQLSQQDVELHKAYFPEPWQAALLLAFDRHGAHGGFIRHSDEPLFFNRNLVAFYELADPDAEWDADTKPTVVDWRNYETAEDVRLLDPGPSVKVPADDEGPPPRTGAPDGSDDDRQEARDADGGEPTLRSDPSERPAAKKRPAIDEAAETAHFHEILKPGPVYDPAEGRLGPWREALAGGRLEAERPSAGPAKEPREGARRRPRTAPPARRRRQGTLDPTDPDLAEFMEVIRGDAPFSAEVAETDVAPDDLPIAGEPVPEPGEETETRSPTSEPRRSPDPESAEKPAPAAGMRPPARSGRRLPFQLVSPQVGPEEPAVAAESVEAPVAAGTGVASSAGEPVAAEPPEEPVTAPSLDSLLEEVDQLMAGAEDGTLSEPRQKSAAPAVEAAGASAGRRAAESADAFEQDVPLVMPSPDAEFLSERTRAALRRSWRSAVWLVLIVATAVVTYSLVGRSKPPTAETPTVTGVTTTAGVPAFRRLGESLAEIIAAYNERRSDFELGRIGCTGLANGHHEVTWAFVDLSERFATLGSRLPLSERLEYRQLAVQAREVTRHFEQAGCTRP